MKFFSRTLFLLAPLFFALALSQSAILNAQSSGARYFDETGHSLSSPFREYWESHNGAFLLGAPITEAFDFKGITVQYFERGRLELRNYQANQVLVSNLVSELGYARPPIDNPPSPLETENYIFYPATGHMVSYAFLKFFKSNGGIDAFGYPISEYDIDKGLIVQYFQKAIFQWNRNEPDSSKQITLKSIGPEHFTRAGIETWRLQRVPPVTPTVKVSGVQIAPFKEYAVQFGDSWASIAKTNNLSVDNLIRFNNRANDPILVEGQVVRIPTDPSLPDSSPNSLKPTPDPTLPTIQPPADATIENLNIDTSIESFVAWHNQNQRLTFTVKDTSGHPMPKVPLIVTVRFSGRPIPSMTVPTNGAGQTIIEFRIPPDQWLGILSFDVHTNTSSQSGVYSGWFLVF